MYYSTFIPGLVQPVEEALSQTLPDCKIILSLDGLIVFDSHAPVAEMQKLKFVTNTFHLIRQFGPTGLSFHDMAVSIAKDHKWRVKIPIQYRQHNTFRLVTSVGNKLVEIDRALLNELEQRIISQTGLRSNRSKPDFEFWLSQRTEGDGFFSFRVTYHKAYDKTLRKGELRPELANVLCRLSEPCADDLFLDPFCGSGAIAIQRAKFFPKGLVIASDIDRKEIDALKDRIKELGLTKRVVVRCDDALNLNRYQNGSIHKIVTDPPWGHFKQTSISITDFYSRMLEEIARILRKDGRAVILTAEAGSLDEGLKNLRFQLCIAKRINILLSGKKASIYVLTPSGG